MKITEYALFALALVELTLGGLFRLLTYVAALAFFTVIAAIFYAILSGAIYLMIG